MVFHVLNRTTARTQIFAGEGPRQWLLQVNRPQPKAERETGQTSMQRGRPFGSAVWRAMTAEKLGLESTFQPRGRPRKHK
jgi:hypothetical protein